MSFPEKIRQQLLQDAWHICDSLRVERILSRDLVAHLLNLPGGFWTRAYGGSPMGTQFLANLLRPFGIRPKCMRVSNITGAAYMVEDIRKAWAKQLKACKVVDGFSTTSPKAKTGAIPPSTPTNEEEPSSVVDPPVNESRSARVRRLSEKALDILEAELYEPLPEGIPLTDTVYLKLRSQKIEVAQEFLKASAKEKVEGETDRTARLEQIRKEILYASLVIDREEWEDLKKKAPFLQEPENPSPKSATDPS